MREINVVSRARISENGKSVLYEKRYHGILTENASRWGRQARLNLHRKPKKI